MSATNKRILPPTRTESETRAHEHTEERIKFKVLEKEREETADRLMNKGFVLLPHCIHIRPLSVFIFRIVFLLARVLASTALVLSLCTLK